MAKKIIPIYKNVYSCLRSDYLFILMILLTTAICVVHRTVNSETDISHYLAYYEVNRPLYDDTFSFIFFENMQAMFQMIYMGLIPFFLGYLFHLFMAADSLVASFGFILTGFPLEMVIMGTLPHGIFEIPAIIFSIILSAIISKEITLFLLSLIVRKKFDDPESVFHRHGLKETAVFCFESLVFVVLPLVLLGALTETFVTGWVVETFL